MTTKKILSNYISNILKIDNYNEIYVYGSKDLEIEKILSKVTSSSIIGGDVHLNEKVLGEFYSNKPLDKELIDKICVDFNEIGYLNRVKQVVLALIWLKYFNKSNHIHNSRIKEHVKENISKLVDDLSKKFQSKKIKLKEFYSLKLNDFIQKVKEKSLLIIDARNFRISKEILNNIGNKKFIFITAKEIDGLKNKVLSSEKLLIYSNLSEQTFLYEKNFEKKNFFFNIFTEKDLPIEDIKLQYLTQEQFNCIRDRYISKNILEKGKADLCIGLFSKEKLFGIAGICNDYRHKSVKEIEQPSVYLMTDLALPAKIKHLSKLVLYCILSKEMKLLIERFIKKEVKSICTNVFTDKKASIKYRVLFKLSDRKEIDRALYNLSYYSALGKWTLEEGVELWKQKLLK